MPRKCCSVTSDRKIHAAARTRYVTAMAAAPEERGTGAGRSGVGIRSPSRARQGDHDNATVGSNGRRRRCHAGIYLLHRCNEWGGTRSGAAEAAAIDFGHMARRTLVLVIVALLCPACRTVDTVEPVKGDPIVLLEGSDDHAFNRYGVTSASNPRRQLELDTYLFDARSGQVTEGNIAETVKYSPR